MSRRTSGVRLSRRRAIVGGFLFCAILLCGALAACTTVGGSIERVGREGLALSPEAAPGEAGVEGGADVGDGGVCDLSSLCTSGACPDLTIDSNQLKSSASLDVRDFLSTDCAIVEGCVAAPGTRTLLRFDTATPNIGTGDLHLGDPVGNACFEWSACHGHYHFNTYANYVLYASDKTTVVATGHKQSFCLEDVAQVSGFDSGTVSMPFSCGDQGIHVGWEDIYGAGLDCQWIDITGVPPGTYWLSVTINFAHVIPELDYTNNTALVEIILPGPVDGGDGGTCVTDLDCVAPLPHCAPLSDPKSGQCVQCVVNDDCTAANPNTKTPVCDKSGGATQDTCRACASNADCAISPGPLCATSGSYTGQCVQCLTDGDCVGNPFGTHCVDVGQTYSCVQCIGTADCQGTTPVCDPAAHQCSACQGDYPASPLGCPTAASPACQPTSSVLAGSCTECSVTNQSLCLAKPTQPACNPAVGQCGCTLDSDCGTKTGQLCDRTQLAGKCVNGCRVAAGVDNCPAGKTCSKRDGSAGQCQPEPCSTDADCKTAPNRKCDTGAEPHGCVECLSDGDCAADKVCDSDPSSAMHHTCVACTATQTSRCTIETGTRCLASDTCGCVVDGECGDRSSGRVCSETDACENGCRGAGGGNGCPQRQVCSSTTAAIGQCGPPTGGDAGPGEDAAAPGDNGSPTGDTRSGCACRASGGASSQGALGGALCCSLLVLAARRRRRG